VKGQLIPLRLRIQVTVCFAAAFIAASLAIFALAHASGAALGVAELPIAWRWTVAGMALLALAAVDLYAVRRKTYCPITLRRQTPRSLRLRFSPTVGASLWGLDTGLAVTTFRVSAATWAALLLTFLGFGTWWIGICYGIAFVVPLMGLLWIGPVGKASAAPDPLDPGLDRLISSRPFAQFASAVLMCAGALIVLAFGFAAAGTGLAMTR
jgi:hypothetical protein